ncbi:MAG: hypothetical protein COA78_26260 [Blastopirellula sp.]|nr:MAG: hypothetical protein COA78_26260 [Blastopirellula sp.]
MPNQILHIDDSAFILHLVSTQLRKHGFEVVSLDDPTKAIDTIKALDIRICIIDNLMPGMNGIELLESIKQMDSSIQVIMLSGKMQVAAIAKACHLGAEACFFKPVKSFDSLIEFLVDASNKNDHWMDVLEHSHCDFSEHSV